MPRAPAALSGRLLSRCAASLRCVHSTSLASSKPQSDTDRIPPRQDAPIQGASGENRPQAQASPTSSRKANTPGKAKAGRKETYIAKHIPPQAKGFFQGGKIIMNRDGWEFIEETKLEWDTSKSRVLRPKTPSDQQVLSIFKCRVSFSESYHIHPFHIVMLRPWGHPMAEAMQNQYRERIRDDRLWLHFVCYDHPSAVVANTGKRRLLRAFWSALEELERQQEPPGLSRLKGTVFVELWDLRQAAMTPAVRFGEVAARMVMEERKRHVYD